MTEYPGTAYTNGNAVCTGPLPQAEENGVDHFAVMMVGFLLLLIPAIQQKWPVTLPLQLWESINTGQHGGKNTIWRCCFCHMGYIFYGYVNGSVNAMHDSLTPLGGMLAMLGMMINSFSAV